MNTKIGTGDDFARGVLMEIFARRRGRNTTDAESEVAKIITLGHDAIVRAVLSDVLHNCGKSRELIARQITEIVGRKVTVQMLNDFTAQSKSHAANAGPGRDADREGTRFPAAWIEPISIATGDERLQLLVMGSRLRKLVVFARRELTATDDKAQRRALREELLAELGQPNSPEKGRQAP